MLKQIALSQNEIAPTLKFTIKSQLIVQDKINEGKERAVITFTQVARTRGYLTVAILPFQW